MQGLRQHNLDFEIISTGNPKTLVFIDASTYFATPEKPLLEITLPGYNKYFLANVVASKVNTFNSNTIGLTRVLNESELTELPDGIYRFRYKICPYDEVFIDKKYFRTTQIENKLAELYGKLEASDCSATDDKSLLMELAEVHALIEGAKGVRVGCITDRKANSFYQLALALVEKLTNKLCNNCS
jgi:hypothetical protein